MKWGVISYGTITPKFLVSLLSTESEELVAIATSTNVAGAQKDFPDVTIYDKYEDLYHDPDVEIVYISSTHNTHFRHGIELLKAKKHVLCEKPMTTNYMDTLSLVHEARKQNVFLMEAIWTRCMPAYRKMIEIVRDGEIGEVEYLQANFSFYNDWGDERRLFNKQLAGGATYDVGIYNLSLAFDVMGEDPVELKSVGDLTSSQVDKACANLLSYSGGRMASLHCGFRLDTDHRATIFGTDGWIEMDLHWKVQRLKVHKKGIGTVEIHLPFLSNGYAHEIIEAVNCIKKGKIESDLISHNTSLNLSRAIDQILVEIGYK